MTLCEKNVPVDAYKVFCSRDSTNEPYECTIDLSRNMKSTCEIDPHQIRASGSIKVEIGDYHARIEPVIASHKLTCESREEIEGMTGNRMTVLSCPPSLQKLP